MDEGVAGSRPEFQGERGRERAAVLRKLDLRRKTRAHGRIGRARCRRREIADNIRRKAVSSVGYVLLLSWINRCEGRNDVRLRIRQRQKFAAIGELEIRMKPACDIRPVLA